jgi:hypothetical protein
MSDRFDAGLLNDFGGGNVQWWQDYIRSLLEQAHDHYDAQVAAEVARADENHARLVKSCEMYELRANIGDLARRLWDVEQACNQANIMALPIHSRPTLVRPKGKERGR